MKVRPWLLLLILTSGAVWIHGYHPWAEDAEIYLPGVEKLLQPQLFPFGSEFFQHHASLTLFPNLMAALVRTSHFSLEWVLFLVHLGSIFLLLWAGWELSGRCFRDARARWGGVILLAALLTLPVAGTALYVMDQYVNPRNVVAFALVLSISKVVDRKYAQAGLLLAFGGAIHPLMSVFALCLCLVVVSMDRFRFQLQRTTFAMALPFGMALAPPSAAYHEVALSHTYHYLTKWQWYEWLGIGGPLVILWWLSRVARSQHQPILSILCRALIVYELICTAGALVLSISPRLESLARIQPMRSLHLLYILLIVLGGGTLAQYVLGNHWWRWVALLVPLCAGMWFAQRSLFPASAHIEWPGAEPRNPWVQAFVWIRRNTPADAIFALNPFHMQLPGEDANGFRVIAERSMLADAIKDSGAVTMFPPMAEDWQQQVRAQRGWKEFDGKDFQRLRTQFGVSWVVLERPGLAGAWCPFENEAVLVCPNPAP